MPAMPEPARVVVVRGHMVDAPDRPHPRFPPSAVPRVGAEVAAALDRWAVGPATTLVTGGARGADILAAEAALARGARLRLVLARPPEEFVEASVALPGSDWTERFRALLPVADVEVVDGEGDEVFTLTNERILAVARALDAHPYAIVVWDGERGDGPGGTEDFVRRLGAAGERLVVIDPMA
jgi:NAD(P)-dependent dehydrogenase (short-subunit alcohol dehydrogenase family)